MWKLGPKNRRLAVALLGAVAIATLVLLSRGKLAQVLRVDEVVADSAARWTISSDFERLAHSEAFVGGIVGMADGPSPQLLAFNRLLKAPDAGPTFRRMVKDGSPAGRLYGLCGLRLSDRSGFIELLPRVRGSREVVKFADACEPAAAFLGEIAPDRDPNASRFCDALRMPEAGRAM